MINRIKRHYPKYKYVESDHFQWSPSNKTIYYRLDDVDATQSMWAFLHEIGHAELNHNSFESDMDLIKKERAAWTKASLIAAKYELDIDPEYIEDCLDSYRDWQKARATCPECHTVTNQRSAHSYHCFNCGCQWKVSSSQICHVRRSKIVT